MPIYRIKGPDGRTYELEGPAGASREDVIREVERQYLTQPATPASEAPQSGFIPALKSGYSELKSGLAALAGRTGITDNDAAKQYIAEQEAYQKRTFKPTETFGEAPLTKGLELLGGSIPYMAAPIVAGGIAATAPVSTPALATALGFGAAGAASATQFTGSNLRRQMGEGKELQDTDLGSAVAAAIPQAALDALSFKMLPGVRQILSAAGTNVAPAVAKRIAEQGIKEVAKDYALATGKAMGTEGLTEAGQQVLERLQAGLQLADPEARKEYFDSFVGGAVLGGALSPVGRYSERSQQSGKEEAATLEEAKKLELEQAKAREAAAAARKTPEGQLAFAKDYEARLARFNELKAVPKPGKDSTPLERSEYQEVKKERDELGRTLYQEAKEYKAAQTTAQQVAEKARVQGLSPEEFMLEQLGTPTPSRGMRPVGQRGELTGEPAAPVVEPVDNAPAEYLSAQIQAAREMGVMDLGDLADFAMQDPAMATRAVQMRPQVDGLSPAENNALLTGIKLRLKALEKKNTQEAKDEFAQRTTDLKSQLPTRERTPTNFFDQFLDDNANLDELRQQGFTEAEIADMERMALMQRDTTEQGELFGEQTRVEGQTPSVQNREVIQGRLDDLKSQLDIAYAQRNVSKGGQYRETIRSLIEQIRQLEPQAALPTDGELGGMTSGIQDQLGSLAPQPAAMQERAEGLQNLARLSTEAKKGTPGTSEEAVQAARDYVLQKLVEEIQSGGRTLRPETVTQIEQQAGAILDSAQRYNAFGTANAQLDAISQKWRTGVQRSQPLSGASSSKPTPTTVTPEMLREQLDRAFAQREKYDPETQALLERVADNLGPIGVNPERTAMVSDWLHRATVTGTANPEMAQEVRDELAALDRAKQVESYTPTRETAWGTATKPTVTQQQLELPDRLLPKKVSGETKSVVRDGKVVQEGGGKLEKPAKTSTAFETAAQFQQFLASDAVKQMRREVGQNADTASRLFNRLGVFRKKYTTIIASTRKQIEALEARKAELVNTKGAATADANRMLSEAQASLQGIMDRLDAELADLQDDYNAAADRFELSAVEAEAVSRQLADNVAKFRKDDDELIESTGRLAALKADAARITRDIAATLNGGTKGGGNITTLVDTRERIIKAIADIKAKVSRSDTLALNFLQAQMEIEYRQQAAEKQLDRAGRALLEAGAVLSDVQDGQRSNPAVRKEIDAAQRALAAALDIKQSVLPEVVGNVDTELAKIEQDIANAGQTIQNAQSTLEKKEQIGQPKPKAERVTRDVRGKTDDEMREERRVFEETMTRLRAIPGQRIDFSKRREMQETMGAAHEQFFELSEDIRQAQDGIDEVTDRIAPNEEEAESLRQQLAKYKTRRSPKSVALQNRLDLLTSRIEAGQKDIAFLEKAIQTAQSKTASLQKAYEKALVMTSTDPEIYRQVTEDIDRRIEKLQRNIDKNAPLVNQTVGKNGRPLSQNTINKRKQRQANYKREMDGLTKLRSNRLGITRTNVGEGAANAEKRRKASQTEQEQFDAEFDRSQQYASLTEELARLEQRLEKAVASKQPKAPDAIRAKIAEVTAQRAQYAPKPMGKVSAASRTQSAAPGKLRTGTKESREATGKGMNRVQEQRTTAQPTVAKAVADANAASAQRQAGQTKAQREAAAKDAALGNQAALLAAADRKARELQKTVATLEARRDELIPAAEDNPKSAAPAQLRKVREQLASTRSLLDRAEAEMARLENAPIPRIEGDTVSDIEGTEAKGTRRTKSMGAMDDIYADETYGDDTGGVVYRTGQSGGKGVDLAALGTFVTRMIKDWTNLPEVITVQSVTDLPAEIQTQAAEDGVQDRLPGLYDPNTDTVYLVADNLYSPEDVVAVVAHEIAGHFGLRKMLGAKYKATMNAIYDGNSAVRKKADAKRVENPNLSLEVSVEEVLADMAETPPAQQTPEVKSVLRRIFDAIKAWFKQTTGDTVSDAAVQQVVANARRYVIQGGKAGAGTAPITKNGPLYKVKPVYANAEMARVGKATEGIVAKQRSWSDKLKANLSGLAFETQLVDRFAGFERLAKYMDSLKGSQMLYYLRMYDQRMNFTSQSVSSGAPRLVEKTRADGRKEYVLESKAGPSIKGVVQTLSKARPYVGNAEAVNTLFTKYLAALRADRVGLNALNFGGEVTKEMLADVRRVVEGNPELKKVFDEARAEYNAYNRNLMEFLSETGALSDDVAKRLAATEDYIPFYREQNGNAMLFIGGENPIKIGSIAEQPHLQELVGGDEAILDFLTSSVQNTSMLVDMGLRNLATKNAVFELVNLNAAKIVRGQPTGTDVVKFKVNGEDRYAVMETESVTIGGKRFETGVPADLLVKGMEGIPAQMPMLLRVMAAPAQLLRKAVTLSPVYMAKQLFRDSLAAPILAGANFTPVVGALRQLNGPAKQKLRDRGITGGQYMTGTNEDMTKILRDLSDGKAGWMVALGKLEALGMEADALTRRAQYNSYIEQGMSEMEATLMALESMNFNKRGASPSVHMANALIPFFNAQIQGLNVLYKAFTGQMPFNDKVKLRQKLLLRGTMVAATTLIYAAMMEDDEAYQNAQPDQKYGNWFVRVPGVDEPVRIPIPFEVGYIFKALPEALYNSLTTKEGGEEAAKAFKRILISTIPGGSSYGIPQIMKPAIEAGLGKSFYTGRDILSAREKELLPEEQFRAGTAEVSKVVGQALGVSPVMMESLVRGYTGTLGLAFLHALSLGVPKSESPEAAVKRLSEYPLIGGTFQPNDAGGILNTVYERFAEDAKVRSTYKKLVDEGRTAEANALLQRRGNEIFEAEIGDVFKQNMSKLIQAERAIAASSMTAQEKRKQLDEIRKIKTGLARTLRDVADKTRPQ